MGFYGSLVLKATDIFLIDLFKILSVTSDILTLNLAFHAGFSASLLTLP